MTNHVKPSRFMVSEACGSHITKTIVLVFVYTQQDWYPHSPLPLRLLVQMPSTMTTLAGYEGNVVMGVGYLQSYEHMGMFKVECVSGCKCEGSPQLLPHPMLFRSANEVWCSVISTTVLHCALP